MKFLKKYNFTVYIELVIALAIMVAGIMATFAFTQLQAVEVPDTVMYLTIGGFVAFVVLTLCRMPRLGAAIVAAAGLIAGGLFALGVYNYPMEEIMNNLNILEIPYMLEMIIYAGIMLGGGLMSNLFAWIPMMKKEKRRK